MNPPKAKPLDSSIIKQPLKTLSELRKYIERPKVVEVKPQFPRRK